MNIDAQKFVGVKYEMAPGRDCMWFSWFVLSETYGQDRLKIPAHPGRDGHMEWLDEVEALMRVSEPAETMKDGYVALFEPTQVPKHTGIVLMSGHEPRVLHAESRIGSSALQPLRLLSRPLRLKAVYNPFKD